MKVKWTKEILSEAVKDCFSISAVLSKLGLKLTGGSYHNISGRIKSYGIDISHFTGQGYLKGKSHTWAPKIELEKVLVKNSSYSRGNLKRRLLKEGMLVKHCYICKGLPEWQGSPLTLELDHINGDPHDNRIENLRLLCPNCHSQTETFSKKTRVLTEGVEPTLSNS